LFWVLKKQLQDSVGPSAKNVARVCPVWASQTLSARRHIVQRFRDLQPPIAPAFRLYTILPELDALFFQSLAQPVCKRFAVAAGVRDEDA
jgi:hypothetical protein